MNFIDESDLSEDMLNDMAKKIMAIDLGVICLATCVSFSLDTPLIYNGGIINFINNKYACLKNSVKNFYKKLISAEQSKISTEQIRLKKKKEDIVHTTKLLNNLWNKRDNLIRNQFERITNDILKVCKENGITEIIIGYNKNWKNGVDMGHEMNDKFYKIPYRKFIDMLFYKGANNGINVREINESYTSICDALSLETIGFHERYMGKRKPPTINSKRKITSIKNKKRRGLFQSARGVLINSDVNGAINIMRRGVQKRAGLMEALEEIIQHVELKKVCNPKYIRFLN